MGKRQQRAEEDKDEISLKRIRQASASSSSVSQSARPELHGIIDIAVPMTTPLLVPVHLAPLHRVNNKLVAPSLHDHDKFVCILVTLSLTLIPTRTLAPTLLTLTIP